MGSGFSKMKKQMKKLEQQMGTLQQKSFTGSSGAGLVTVTLNGEKSLLSLKIKPECVDPTDVEGLEDLITQAFTEASTKVEEETSAYSL